MAALQTADGVTLAATVPSLVKVKLLIPVCPVTREFEPPPVTVTCGTPFTVTVFVLLSVLPPLAWRVTLAVPGVFDALNQTPTEAVSLGCKVTDPGET
jgi:hypothetical protein